MIYPTSSRTFSSRQNSEDEEILNELLIRGNRSISSRQIMEKILELRCLGLTSFQIRTRMKEIGSQFTVDAETIGTHVKAFERDQSTVLQGFKTTESKIQATTLNTTAFKKKEKANESVHASFQGFVQDRAWEHVVAARVTAKAVETVGAAVGFVVKESTAVLLGCRGEGEKNCKVVRSYIKKGVEKVEDAAKDVVTRIGAKPALKRIIKAEAVIHRLGELGIDEKHAAQYVHDGRRVARDAAFAVTGGWTMKLVKEILPGNILGSLKGAKRESRLLKEHEHRIENSKSTVTKVNEKGQKIVEETEHATYYLAPQAKKTAETGKKSSYPSTKGSLRITKSATPLLLGPKQSLPTPKTAKGMAQLPKPLALQLLPSSALTIPPPLTSNNLDTSELQTTVTPPLLEPNPHKRPIILTQLATGLFRREKVIPEHSNVKKAIAEGPIIEYFCTDHLSPVQEFIQDNINGPFTLIKIENPGNENISYIVRDLDNQPIAFVKEFADATGSILEIVSLSILQAEQLNASFQTIQAIGKYTTPYGKEIVLVMYPFNPGQTLDEFVKYGFDIPAERIGQVLSEINSVSSILPVSPEYIKHKIHTISLIAKCVLMRLNELRVSTPLTMERIEMIANDMANNPGKPGLVHGDADPRNFLIHNNKVTIIDTGTLVASVNRVGMAHGMPAFDQQNIVASMYYLGALYGYPQKKVERIITEFLTGYRRLMPVAGSEPAERFAHLYHEFMNLDDLIRGQYNKHLLDAHIERVNTVFGQTHVKSTVSSPIRQAETSLSLCAERINQVFSASLYFPPPTQIQITQVEQLHDIWARNQETLLGIIAKEEIPSFGLHGSSYLGIKTIMNGKTPVSEVGNYLFVSGIPVTKSPLDQLGAFYAIVVKAREYMGKKGGLFIVDMSIAIPKAEGIDEHVSVMPLDTPLQKRILWKVEGLSHARELLVPFDESNYSKVIKGLILEEETLYPGEFVKSLATDGKDITPHSEVLTERFRIQETLITVFEKLGVIKDFQLSPWETYRKIGKEILTGAEEELKRKINDIFSED